MPTAYTDTTEQMVLEAFRRKVDQEEGVFAFEKSESPDGIIRTQAGKNIGIEVTSAIRTDDSSTNLKDKNKIATFLNKFGLYDSNGPSVSSLFERFTDDSYIESLLSKIRERIQKKEANDTYRDFKARFTKSVLVVYLDDLYLDLDTLQYIIGQNSFSNLLNLFDEAYLYVRPTQSTSPSGIQQVGGFYLIGQRKQA